MPTEPYEDPDTEPGFVRTEKGFLKDHAIKTAKRELEKQQNSIMEAANDMSLTKSIDVTFLKEVDKSSTMHSSGMSMENNDRVAKNSSFF